MIANCVSFSSHCLNASLCSEEAHRRLADQLEALRASEADGDWSRLDRLAAPPSEDESAEVGDEESSSVDDSESYFTAAEV